MSCAPARTTAISVRVAQAVYSGAVRKVVLIPARPAGLSAAARTALLVSASAAQLPVRPGGAPYHQHQLSVDHAAPRIGLTTALLGTVAQYTAHSAINAARLANCEPR